jgi:enterochelin esterase-like enzyme
MHLRRLSLNLAVLSLAILSPHLSAQGRGGGAATTEMKNFTFAVKSFHSDAVGSDMPYGIYLPKDYDAADKKDVKWPLVIWLHGMFEDHLRFHGRGVGAPMLDQAVSEGKLPPCVFVLANGGRTSMYINAGKGREYQDLIEKDLLDHVSQNYRVRQDRDGRALMGISMGGMAALRIGFTHPDLFKTIAVHSSAVFPEDPEQLPDRIKKAAKDFGFSEVFGDPIDKEKWAATNPLGIVKKLDAKSLQGMRIYFDAGTQDRFQFCKSNAMLHDVLAEKKIEHSWTLVQGGGHAWGSGFQPESLLASLMFVGDGFKAANAKDAKADKDGADKHEPDKHETGKKPAGGNGDGKEHGGEKKDGAGIGGGR